MADHKQPWQLKGPFAHLFATFYNHPKVMRAAIDNPGSVGVYALSLSYSIDQRADGFIPHYQADRFIPTLTPEQSAELTAILVKHGLWDVVPGGFQIHDWLEHNPSADYLKGKSEQGKHAVGVRWAKRKDTDSNTPSNTEGDSDVESEKKKGGAPRLLMECNVCGKEHARPMCSWAEHNAKVKAEREAKEAAARARSQSHRGLFLR
jgi:hypothetical protein